MLYNSGYKFNVENSETSALSIHSYFNELLSLLIKTVSQNYGQTYYNATSILFSKRSLFISYILLFNFLDVAPMYFLVDILLSIV